MDVRDGAVSLPCHKMPKEQKKLTMAESLDGGNDMVSPDGGKSSQKSLDANLMPSAENTGKAVNGMLPLYTQQISVGI